MLELIRYNDEIASVQHTNYHMTKSFQNYISCKIQSSFHDSFDLGIKIIFRIFDKTMMVPCSQLNPWHYLHDQGS